MKLQLIKSVILNIRGPVTDKQYTFGGRGSIVEVDDEDGQIMKDKMAGQACCSGAGPTPYFLVVEEPISTRSEENELNNRIARRNTRSRRGLVS